MKSTLKSLICFSLAGLATVVVLVTPARSETVAENETRLAAGLDKAMRAVFYGLNADDLAVNGHRFNIPSSRFARAGSLTMIEGELTHRGSSGRDERLHYTIRKRGTVVLSTEIWIDGKPPRRWTNKLAKYLVGVPVRDGQLESISRRLGRIAGGDWKTTAELIVASAAVRADPYGRDRLAMRRARLSRAAGNQSSLFGRSAEVIRIPRADHTDRDSG